MLLSDSIGVIHSSFPSMEFTYFCLLEAVNSSLTAHDTSFLLLQRDTSVCLWSPFALTWETWLTRLIRKLVYTPALCCGAACYKYPTRNMLICRSFLQRPSWPSKQNVCECYRSHFAQWELSSFSIIIIFNFSSSFSIFHHHFQFFIIIFNFSSSFSIFPKSRHVLWDSPLSRECWCQEFWVQFVAAPKGCGWGDNLYLTTFFFFFEGLYF